MPGGIEISGPVPIVETLPFDVIFGYKTAASS